MKGIILAAGLGTRLGSLVPKPLTPLVDEVTILDTQVSNLASVVGIDNVIVVVGYKKELIMEMHPELVFVYNSAYAHSNTAYSLLLGLKKTDEDVIWMNGDVFAELKLLGKLSKSKSSVLVTNKLECGEEEVKYSIDENGFIHSLSKSTTNAQGESLGLNYFTRADAKLLRGELARVGKNDYFEKAIENLTLSRNLELRPMDVEHYVCKEIDFQSDLIEVQNSIRENKLKLRQ